MTFRIIDDEVIDNDIMPYFRYIGRSDIDFSKIYQIKVEYPQDVLKKMHDRDINYLLVINRKNKINKLNKNDKINISDYFIDFYIKNIDKVYLIISDNIFN